MPKRMRDRRQNRVLLTVVVSLTKSCIEAWELERGKCDTCSQQGFVGILN